MHRTMAHQAGDEIGKLFVGGLDWNTSQEGLQIYFSQFGEVIDCVIMKDKETNQSRGFGFVKFKDPNCIGMVLANRPHCLDGRTIDPKPCTPRSMQTPKQNHQERPPPANQNVIRCKKIFVGGIPHNCGDMELREYFKRFGMVTEVVMIYDQLKQRPRGFGFISFEDEQSVDQAVNLHFHDIMGKKVEVKRAEPRDGKPQTSGQWGSRNMPASNGWGGQPPSAPWQQPGGYAAPGGFAAGRGAPATFNLYPAPPPAPASYNPPPQSQAFGQGAYSQAPQYGLPAGFPGYPQPAQPDQFGPPAVPPQATGPQHGQLGFPAPQSQNPNADIVKPPSDYPTFSQFGMGNYPQDPSGYGPTRPTQAYSQNEQSFGPTGYGQEPNNYSQAQGFSDPNQQAQGLVAGGYGRGQSHPFHPYRR
ncbi:DAZ-associated protein 1 isoform X1 [Petromyzon marinus]|uniref:DAZ-associated protein 1 isoform X2 n=1 Tax=Petromyzon marinus TaxID=7757 RepID=A0AAJ7U4S4_PETMA|nr:DAZ-associated protein 1 isoform X2 [Petromyzon marinus]